LTSEFTSTARHQSEILRLDRLMAMSINHTPVDHSRATPLDHLALGEVTGEPSYHEVK